MWSVELERKMALEEKINEVKEYLKKYDKLNQAIALIYWDMRTNMPEKAGESRVKFFNIFLKKALKC